MFYSNFDMVLWIREECWKEIFLSIIIVCITFFNWPKLIKIKINSKKLILSFPKHCASWLFYLNKMQMISWHYFVKFFFQFFKASLLIHLIIFYIINISKSKMNKYLIVLLACFYTIKAQDTVHICDPFPASPETG